MKATGFSRVSKESIISEIEKELPAVSGSASGGKKCTAFFIATHDGVSASKIDKLRAKLRASQTRYLVVKNTLGQKAFDRAKLKELSQYVRGACGIAFSAGDGAFSSKTLMEFAKENENFKVQAGYLNGQLLGAEQVKFLAMLPSREMMLARVFGTLQAPISGFVSVLAGTLRKVVTGLDAVAKKKSQS